MKVPEMKKDKLRSLQVTLIFAVFALFFIVSASAELKYYSNNINKNYRIGEFINGNINLTIFNGTSDGLLTSNFLGNISLIKLLGKNEFLIGKDYNCSNTNCNTNFKTEIELTEFDFDGDEYVGLNIQGEKIEDILNLELEVELEKADTCDPPLLVGLLGYKNRTLTSTGYKDVSCSPNVYGCFDNSLGKYSSVVIEDNELCESIIAPPAPAYRIGARIENSSSGRGDLEMTLYNEEGIPFSCDLKEHNLNMENLDCIVEIGSGKEANFTVCISSPDYYIGGPNYKIRTEKKGHVCGTNNRDLEIFIRPLQFSQKKIGINESNYEKHFPGSFEEYVYQYLVDHYPLDEHGYLDCTNTCVIPIKLTGSVQKLKFKNIDLTYRDGGFIVDENANKYIYSLVGKKSVINSGILNINFDDIFRIDKNENLFVLNLNSKEIFRENISVSESFEFEIEPKFAFFGIETEFKVKENISINSSMWDFGSVKKQSDTGKIKHSFKDMGDYTIKVEVLRDDKVLSFREFMITVGNPKESVNITIEKYRNRLEELSLEVDKTPHWLQDNIRNLSSLNEISETLDFLEQEFLNSKNDSEYVDIMRSLLDLEIPVSISVVNTIDSGLFISNNIDLKYIEEISGSESNDNNYARGLISGWYEDNYNANLGIVNYGSLFEDDSRENIITEIKIQTEQINSGGGYLIIDYPFESITFREDYGQRAVSEGSGTYLFLQEQNKEVELYVEGYIDAEDLRIYISPVLSDLGIENEKPTCFPGDLECAAPFPWKFVLIWISVILCIVIVLYILMQEWYKRHYEISLFHNKDDLYNLINFIFNSRRAGLNDDEIIRRLKPNWSRERIKYVFKKLDGQRTGLWEIPIFKIFEKKKVRKEIMKRQISSNGTKFIKHPRY